MKVAVIYNKRETDVSDVINIFGPQTKEHYNPHTIELVTSALEKGGHNVKIIEGNISVADELRNFMPRVIAGERPGMVFNMAYGIQGYSRYTHLPAMLEMLGVPYVGSGPQAHAIAMDKVMSKILFQQNSLPTPHFWVFSSPEEYFDDIVYPVIVKPKMEAVSMGMKIVNNAKDLRNAVQEIIETYHQHALVESFISGREFAVGLLGNGSNLEILPIVEFNLNGDPDTIQTHENKMENPLEKICPAEITNEIADEMRRLAQHAFQALELHDFARVDIRMDKQGSIYILEINSMASLGITGSYIHAAKVAGYSYDSLVNRMLDVAAVRYFGQTFIRHAQSEDENNSKTQPLRVRIRSYVRSQITTMEDNLRRMVNINSHIYNAEGVNTLGSFISNRLVQLGFQRQVYPQVDLGNTLYFTNHDDDKNDIFLLGHLDNQYGYQEFTAFREERGRFFGSGVAESKGGLTIMLTALQALRFTRRLKRIKCGILLTTDDSLGGSLSKKLITEIAQKSLCVIGLKYGEANGGIVLSCSGRRNFKVELSNVKWGKPAEVPNVISVLSRKITSVQKLSSSNEGVVINPISLEARSSAGMTPDYAVVSFDFQLNDKNQGEDIEQEFRQIIKRNLSEKLQVRIKKGFYRPPVQETEVSKQFFTVVQNLANQLEVRINAVNRTHSSDICYVPEEIPALEGLGPVGGGVRSTNEYIIEDSLIDRATLLALVISESARGN